MSRCRDGRPPSLGTSWWISGRSGAICSIDLVSDSSSDGAPRFSRRSAITATIGLAWGAAASRVSGEPAEPSADDRLAALEASAGGRLGVCILNAETGESSGWRVDERFGMCSTFKVLLAGVILREVDLGRFSLDRAVPFGEDDMVFYAPVTTEHLERGEMSVEELARAAQTTSDNVAANLLLDLLGGPAGFTEILRSLGDSTTRLDRYETEMNLVPAGEIRDTTTPEAMARSVARFVVGDLLTEASRRRLTTWMIETETGRKRIRAGLPSTWRAGDKTGTGIADTMVNKYNDIAVIWPPDRAPHVIAAYYDAPGAYDSIRDEDQAVLAEVGRIASEGLAG